MKALQSRSPIIFYFNKPNLDKAIVKIWFQDNPNDFDVLDASTYEIETLAINEICKFEISELIRSENQFEYKEDFFTTRESATNVLVQTTLIDVSNDTIDVQHDLLRIRDGYVERNEQIQFFENLVPVNVNEWGLITNADLSFGDPDEFNGNNGVLLESVSTATGSEISTLFEGNGTYTFSIYIEPINVGEISLQLGSLRSRATFDLGSKEVTSSGGRVLGYDIKELSAFTRIAISVKDTFTSASIIFEAIQGGLEATIFNAKLSKGNWLHITPEELILQDNFKTYSSVNILPKIIFDRKLADTNYTYGSTNMQSTFENNPAIQSVVLRAIESDLVYQNLQGNIQVKSIFLEELCEPKYTPVKVSFVNRFGVLQDLVFFKKRVNTYKVESENFKSNPIQGNSILPSVGQKKVYNKKAEASLKLSSGFYPESFNEVFKQLLYSELIYIDEEAAIITSSSWTEKTRVNDKLINYNLDFEFANNDINTIQ